MPRLSTLSNPTGLIELDKNRVGIVIDEQPNKLSYSLTKLDLAGVSVGALAKVILIARRGNAELRVDHGLVTDWNKGFVDASELGTDGTLRFRVLVVGAGSAQLLAAAENIKPDGLGQSESLIGLEPADLDQVPWELRVLEQEGRAIIYFNKDLYANAATAEADRHFASLVFPEALRQVASWHTQNPGALSDPPWEPFKNWLTLHGITDEPDDMSKDDMEEWSRSVVRAFTLRFKSVDFLREAVKTGDEE